MPGTSGAGGMPGTSGAAGAGGTSGAAATAGSAGAVGSAGAAGLSSALAAPIGAFPGGIGCSATTCTAGQACCSDTTPGGPHCISSIDACGCAGGTCQIFGCMLPSQCGSGHCCGSANPYPKGLTPIATSCKPSCDPTSEQVVCSKDQDCTAPATCQHPANVGVCL
ncbi:MAG TPA: hypothetical protein VIK01_27345 [Polyangiaceae bacterium]